MSLVTIRGQLGSGSPEIGRLIADKLHVDYVDQEIIAKVALLLKEPQRSVMEKEMPPSGLLERITEALETSYICGGDYVSMCLPVSEIPLDDTRYLAALQSVIRELANSERIVIHGRGSQFILRDYPQALHVLTVAPLEIRVKRVMESLGVDEARARKEIAHYDSSRREFTKRYFKAEREDPTYYDLVINTGHLSFEASASVVVDALAFKNRP